MKNVKWLPVLMAVVLLFCGCSGLPEDGTTQSQASETQTTNRPTTQPTTQSLPEVTEPTAEPTTQPTTEPTVEPTEAPHSELYLPDCSQEQMITYFEEVVLHAEYSDGTGDTSLVQKWLSPIYYRIYGEPTDTDRLVLEDFFGQLNAIDSFPGIYEAQEDMEENLSISFLSPEDFSMEFSDAVNGEDAYGAAQYWYYTLTNELHTARVGYRRDLDQSIRNSILPEEIVNILGISDTTLRTDSITYQYSDDNTALSGEDLVILSLLYDPEIQCGMSREECLPILQARYY